jgi:hypothetical protein
MTVLWQASCRCDLSDEESVRVNLRCVEHWSPTLDPRQDVPGAVMAPIWSAGYPSNRPSSHLGIPHALFTSS